LEQCHLYPSDKLCPYLCVNQCHKPWCYIVCGERAQLPLQRKLGGSRMHPKWWRKRLWCPYQQWYPYYI